MVVSAINKHVLSCANASSLDSLRPSVQLGPFDHPVAWFIPVAAVFVYRRSPAIHNELLPADRLMRSVSLLLDHYPHLTGRLNINSSNGNREILDLGAGAEFYTARCDVSLDDLVSTHSRLLGTDLPGGGNELLAPFEFSVVQGPQGPIFTIQHTRFDCGGVTLGIRVLHTVTDAEGYFQLVNDLAEIYRSVEPATTTSTLSRSPYIRPYLAELVSDAAAAENNIAQQFQPSIFYTKPASSTPDASSESGAEPVASKPPLPNPPPVIGRVLRFSSKEIDSLKAHATDPSGTGWVSTFDALSAHIWQRVYSCRVQLRKSEEQPYTDLSRDFLTSVNYRKTLDLAPRYFHNALFTPFDSIPHGVLVSRPLWPVAKAVHDIARSISHDSAERTVRWIATQPDKRQIRWRFNGSYGSTMISAWNKFDIYNGAVFDTGVPPALVSQPFTPISLVDGLVYFLPTEAQAQQHLGTGSSADVDVYLALSEPVWPVLDNDPLFRQFS